MLPEWTIVGFTGHRHLKHPDKVKEGLHEAVKRLLARHGRLAAVSSAAIGADTLFLKEAAHHNLPLLVLMPFARANFEADLNPTERQRLDSLLDRHAVRIVEGRDSGSAEEAYMQTGEHTVDLADVVIAVWDKQPARGLGGTANVVAYAEALGKPVLCINPDTGKIEETPPPPPETVPPSPGPSNPEGNLREVVEKHLQERDDVAIAHAPKARNLILRIILLHLFASIAGVSTLVFKALGPWERELAAAEVLALARAFYLISQHRKKHYTWMKSRAEAEICRSFLATWHIPMDAAHTQKIALAGFDGIFRSLRLLRQLDRPPAQPSLEEARRQYHEERIQKQLNHFKPRCQEAERRLKWLKTGALACTAGAALCAVISVGLLPDMVLNTTKILSLTLPMISSAIVSLVVTQEYARRAARYREMVSLLEGAAKRLLAVRTWDGLGRVAAETESQLLQEVVEWHSYTRFAGEPH